MLLIDAFLFIWSCSFVWHAIPLFFMAPSLILVLFFLNHENAGACCRHLFLIASDTARTFFDAGSYCRNLFILASPLMLLAPTPMVLTPSLMQLAPLKFLQLVLSTHPMQRCDHTEVRGWLGGRHSPVIPFQPQTFPFSFCVFPVSLNDLQLAISTLFRNICRGDFIFFIKL